MRAELELITPLKAASILKNHNESNRNLNEKTVTMFAREMREGRWGLTHQGIAFYDDGTLADGQHRLSAVVVSDCPTEFLVTYGTKRESSMFMDTGRARSVADVVKISGEADWLTGKMIQMVKLVYGSKKVSPSEVVLLAQPIKEALFFINNAFKANRKGITMPLKAAVMLAYLHGEDADRLTQFAEIMYSGIVTDDKDTAAIRIRDYLAQGNMGLSGGAGQTVSLSKSQSAIFKFCRMQPVKILREMNELPYPHFDADFIINSTKG